MNGTELIVALGGAAGVAAIITAIITGFASKRKLGAEAAEIITQAAAGVVKNLQAEIDRQVTVREDQARQYVETIDAIVESHEEEMDEVRRVLQLHVAWDAIAIAKMAEFGVDLPEAPPLLPARRFHRDHEKGVH